MEDLKVGVKGATCGHCVQAITGAVFEVSGVSTVDVDLDAGEVSVKGDRVDDTAVREAIVEAGYETVG